MIDIVFVPSVRKGNGSGHLIRCFGLANSLGSRAAVYLPEEPGTESWSSDELRLAYPRELSSVRVIESLSPQDRFAWIILDNRETTRHELLHWASHGAVIAIDEGGEARFGVDYLVDILPGLPRVERRRIAANSASLGYLALPEARRSPPAMIRRVLVSFGGEDKAGLTSRFLQLALGKRYLKPEQITVVTGALSEAATQYPGVTAIGPVQDLKEKLSSYDLVVTLFGLTAFEAAWAGCAVLVFNPGRVHEELSMAAGFTSLGVGTAKESVFRRALLDQETLVEASRRAAPAERHDLAAKIASLSPGNSGACPVCGARVGVALFRDDSRSYFRCTDCGMVRMSSFVDKAVPYIDTAYFFDQYKAQYGKTYVEDIPTIRAAAAKRLRILESLIQGGFSGRTLLDVGCAYGAFAIEAQTRGWNAVGMDLSLDAVAYVQSTYAIPAFVADFSGLEAEGLYPRDLYALTMWYVIEHFDDLGRVLDKVARLLQPGGVFAFSTPSLGGISARKSLRGFLRDSPDDHCTVWHPKTATGILRRFGFEVQRIVVTGHHPERFPGVPNRSTSLRYIVAMMISKLFGLGDTFECYAVYTGTRAKGRISDYAE
ncbi:MAG: methyltransferase domain-containing protein [Spirochaetales bacterium]|nr:methyltransferase domain-containing protein [Spirochaetales bacterium]